MGFAWQGGDAAAGVPGLTNAQAAKNCVQARRGAAAAPLPRAGWQPPLGAPPGAHSRQAVLPLARAAFVRLPPQVAGVYAITLGLSVACAMGNAAKAKLAKR